MYEQRVGDRIETSRATRAGPGVDCGGTEIEWQTIREEEGAGMMILDDQRKYGLIFFS